VQFPKVRFLLSVAGTEQFPEDLGREVAFAGRSNSGKSSAINAILVRNGLARTSKTPGRTRLLNFFEVEPGRRIIDLPGYGYAEAPPPEREQWIKLIATLPARECLVGLFLIVGRDLKREGFVVFERRPAVEAQTRDAANGEFDRQHIALFAGRKIAGRAMDAAH
jgi:ribosome biogenesis GTP-binding protein YsxC/EngB